MPRVPHRSRLAQSVRASTFEAFAGKLRARAAAGELIPLHLGDTALPPPLAARRVDPDQPDVHRYGPIAGDPDLRAAIARDLEPLGLAVGPEAVFVAPGATGGLDLAAQAVLEPGDDAIVLAPSWPLTFGLLQRLGCGVLEVDVDPSGWLPPDPALLRARLEAALTPRTAGLYLCDPNNPVGFVYGPAHRAVISAFAREHDLWVFWDAVYSDLVWGAPPEERRLERLGRELADRAFFLFSYSKRFSLAGHRVGALVAPPAVRELIPRLLTHTTYHTGRWAQRLVMASLQLDPAAATAERDARWTLARSGAALVGEALGGVVPHHAPLAGTFVFLDLRERAPDEAAALGLLERCLDAGVALAPGSAFGSRFRRFARLCYTATAPDQLAEGLRRIRPILEPGA